MIPQRSIAALRAAGATDAMVEALLADLRAVERERQARYRARSLSQDMSQDMSQDICHKTEKPREIKEYMSQDKSHSDSLTSLSKTQNKEERKEERKQGLPAGARKRPLPLDWRPSSLACCNELGWSLDRIERELTRFTDHAKAHGKIYVDWDAAWRNWVRSPYQTNGNGTNGHHGKQNLTELAYQMAAEFRARKAADELALDL